jgi:ornithine carbamoyltransferase
MGLDLRVATPEGYEPAKDVVDRAVAEAKDCGTEVVLTHSPEEAVRNSHVIVTDTWVSMGQEQEKAERLNDFAGFQVTEELGRGARPDWKFMHCMPRKKEEVTDDVFESKRSLVWDEAENRMWTVMAVLLAQMTGGMHAM